MPVLSAVTPRLSIVMPVYKRRRYLREAIWSILTQTFRDWELIIVDDGSNDNGAVLAEVWAAVAGDPRIVTLQVEKNLGRGISCGPALNVGFRVARGEYFAWVTDDNIWFPDCYERLVAALDAGADFAYGSQFISDGQSEVFTYAPYIPDLFVTVCCTGIAFAYRRSLAEKVGAYGSTWDTDFDYWKRAHAAGFVAASLPLPPLARYRNHPDTISNKVWADRRPL